MADSHLPLNTRVLVLLLAIILASASAHARDDGQSNLREAELESATQESPAPSHRFWDRTNIVLYGATAAAAAADFWTTRRNLANGGSERNPIARSFAGSNGGFAAYKAGSVASYIGLGYVFHRKGWHKLERVFPMVAISTDGTAASFNLAFSF